MNLKLTVKQIADIRKLGSIDYENDSYELIIDKIKANYDDTWAVKIRCIEDIEEIIGEKITHVQSNFNSWININGKDYYGEFYNPYSFNSNDVKVFLGDNKQMISLGRLLYTIKYGYIGANVVDHVNGSKTDNSFRNLKSISRVDNYVKCRLSKYHCDILLKRFGEKRLDELKSTINEYFEKYYNTVYRQLDDMEFEDYYKNHSKRYIYIEFVNKHHNMTRHSGK